MSGDRPMKVLKSCQVVAWMGDGEMTRFEGLISTGLRCAAPRTSDVCLDVRLSGLWLVAEECMNGCRLVLRGDRGQM